MITYPVSPESRWARYDTVTETVVETGNHWPVADGGPIVGSDGLSIMLLQVDEAPPAYDAETEKLVSSTVIDLPNNEYRRGFTIEALSQSEINTIQRSTQRQAARDLWETLNPHIRGPYQPAFDAANVLLDLGGNEEALELIDSCEPTAKIAADQQLLDEFTYIKAQFLAMIGALPVV